MKWLAGVLAVAIIAPVVGYSFVASVQVFQDHPAEAQNIMDLLRELLGPLLGVIVGIAAVLFGMIYERDRSN